MNKITFKLPELSDLVKKLAPQLEKYQILAFSGPLGAGKTTFIRELLKNYGVTDLIVSPTFNYVNIYKNDQGKTFYHFDLYRIKSLSEFQMAGFNEYLGAENSMAIIEWPEVIDELLKSGLKVCYIDIGYMTEIPNVRSLHVVNIL